MTHYYWMPPGVFVNPVSVGVALSGGEWVSEKVELDLAPSPMFVYMRTMQRDLVSQLRPLVRRLFMPISTRMEPLHTNPALAKTLDGIRSHQLAFALFCLISVTACNFTPTATNNAPPPPTVTVSSGEQSQIIDWETATARVDAVEAVEVRPRVSGHITEIHFAAGQIVHKGDVLFVIDRRWYKAELDRTTAEVARAAAALENAQRISRRADDLLKSHTVAQEEADGRRSELAEAVAALKSAEAARDSAQLDYEQSEVRAPISGKISRAVLTEGNYVSGVSGSNTLLTTIVSVDPVYTYATLDEAAYLRLFEAMRKRLGLPHRDLKMVLGCVKIARGRRGDPGYCLREARDRPQRYRSSVDQLTSKWVELSCLRLLAENRKPLNRKRKQPPRTSNVVLPANWKRPALFIQDCQRASAISLVSHLSKKCPLAESMD